MEFISFLESNKLIILVTISIIFAFIEYRRPMTNDKTFRYQFYQDLLFWFLIIDHNILPSTEDKIEPSLSRFIESNMPYRDNRILNDIDKIRLAV